MEAEGCPIQISALHKVEKGDPPRRVTLDEAIAMAAALGLRLEELVEPMDQVQQARAQEIARELVDAFVNFDDAVVRGLHLYLAYGKIATDDSELLEYLNHHIRFPTGAVAGVDLGDSVTQSEVEDLRGRVAALWAEIARLGTRAAGVSNG
jgi:predicted dinucleotide-utilizing enzyme